MTNVTNFKWEFYGRITFLSFPELTVCDICFPTCVLCSERYEVMIDKEIGCGDTTGHHQSRDSAIDTEVQECEMEICEIDLVNNLSLKLCLLHLAMHFFHNGNAVWWSNSGSYTSAICYCCLVQNLLGKQ